MRFLILILFWSALLYSCKEVSFPEAQPRGVASLQEVPSSLHGTYQLVDQTTGEFSDTLIIEGSGYHFKDKNDKDWLNRGTLSDTLVLKFYKDYYFVNFKTNGQWVVRIIKQEPTGAIRFLSIDLKDDTKRKSILKKLNKKTPVKEIKSKDDTFYQINPSPELLMTLIKEGYFTGEKMNKIK